MGQTDDFMALHFSSLHRIAWIAAFSLCFWACAGRQRPVRSGEADANGLTLPCGEFAQIAAGRPFFSNTAQGIKALHGSCVRADGPACVFTLDVPNRSDVRLRLESDGFDAALSLHGGSAQAPGEIACADDTPSGDLQHARLETTVGPGRYFVVVDSAGAETGDFEVFAEIDPLPPLTAACDAPQVISHGQTVRGSTRGGSDHFTSTCAGGSDGPDHVYALNITEPSRVRVRLSSDYDGSLSLRKVCADASSELSCNDDGPERLRSLITARLARGTYYAITDSFSPSQSGEYALALEQIPEPEPRSLAALCDEVDALPIAPGAHELDTFAEPSLLAGSCGGQDAPERALRFVVSEPSHLDVRVDGAEFNAVLYVRRACREENSEVACLEMPRLDRAKSLTDDAPEALSTELEAGIYTLVVDGVDKDAMGALSLRFSLTPHARERR
jgi:hypothetical protein